MDTKSNTVEYEAVGQVDGVSVKVKALATATGETYEEAWLSAQSVAKVDAETKLADVLKKISSVDSVKEVVLQGPTGPAGPPGNMGLSGPRGLKGNAGPDGPKGDSDFGLGSVFSYINDSSDLTDGSKLAIASFAAQLPTAKPNDDPLNITTFDNLKTAIQNLSVGAGIISSNRSEISNGTINALSAVISLKATSDKLNDFVSVLTDVANFQDLVNLGAAGFIISDKVSDKNITGSDVDEKYLISLVSNDPNFPSSTSAMVGSDFKP